MNQQFALEQKAKLDKLRANRADAQDKLDAIPADDPRANAGRAYIASIDAELDRVTNSTEEFPQGVPKERQGKVLSVAEESSARRAREASDAISANKGDLDYSSLYNQPRPETMEPHAVPESYAPAHVTPVRREAGAGEIALAAADKAMLNIPGHFVSSIKKNTRNVALDPAADDISTVASYIPAFAERAPIKAVQIGAKVLNAPAKAIARTASYIPGLIGEAIARGREVPAVVSGIGQAIRGGIEGAAIGGVNNSALTDTITSPSYAQIGLPFLVGGISGATLAGKAKVADPTTKIGNIIDLVDEGNLPNGVFASAQDAIKRGETVGGVRMSRGKEGKQYPAYVQEQRDKEIGAYDTRETGKIERTKAEQAAARDALAEEAKTAIEKTKASAEQAKLDADAIAADEYKGSARELFNRQEEMRHQAKSAIDEFEKKAMGLPEYQQIPTNGLQQELANLVEANKVGDTVVSKDLPKQVDQIRKMLSTEKQPKTDLVSLGRTRAYIQSEVDKAYKTGDMVNAQSWSQIRDTFRSALRDDTLPLGDEYRKVYDGYHDTMSAIEQANAAVIGKPRVPSAQSPLSYSEQLSGEQFMSKLGSPEFSAGVRREGVDLAANISPSAVSSARTASAAKQAAYTKADQSLAETKQAMEARQASQVADQKSMVDALERGRKATLEEAMAERDKEVNRIANIFSALSDSTISSLAGESVRMASKSPSVVGSSLNRMGTALDVKSTRALNALYNQFPWAKLLDQTTLNTIASRMANGDDSMVQIAKEAYAKSQRKKPAEVQTIELGPESRRIIEESTNR